MYPYVLFLSSNAGLIMLPVEAEDFDHAEELGEEWCNDHRDIHPHIIWSEHWNDGLADEFEKIATYFSE